MSYLNWCDIFGLKENGENMFRQIIDNKINLENVVNLDEVTAATNGDAVNMTWYQGKAVLIHVSVNSGAVTVTIEASSDGTEWYELDQKLYTATTGKDIYSYTAHYPYMRTTTTSHSGATVKTTIVGRS